MIRSSKFWISMVVFQIAFGLTVFAVTRHYYTKATGEVSVSQSVTRQPSSSLPQSGTGNGLEQLITTFPGQPAIQDPVAMTDQADMFFANRQYDEAAKLYEQILAINPNNPSTYNNLGLTLHYLGRSAEALQRLKEGIAIDPGFQRIWLTLGFVNSQLGHTEQARSALTTAVQLGADTEVGRSSAKMLANLGPSSG